MTRFRAGLPLINKHGGVNKAAPPRHHQVYFRLVDGRKRPWWIVGSLPHQKKPRLLVFHNIMSHFKNNFSFLRFEEELSGRLGISLVLTPPATPPWDSWISLTGSKAGGHPRTLALWSLTSVEWTQGQGWHREVGNVFIARKWLLPGNKFRGQSINRGICYLSVYISRQVNTWWNTEHACLVYTFHLRQWNYM